MCGICAIQMADACPIAEAASFAAASGVIAAAGAGGIGLAVLDPASLDGRIDTLLRADDSGIAAWHTTAEPVLTFS